MPGDKGPTCTSGASSTSRGLQQAPATDLHSCAGGGQARIILKFLLREVGIWPLVLFFFLCSAASSFAEPGSPGKYGRHSNLLNPATLFAPDNPLNQAEKYQAPANTPNLRYRFDPNNPTNPETRYIPSNPFTPANRSNPTMPFVPFNRPSGSDR